MLRIAICDDNVHELENTYHLVSNFTKSKEDKDFYVRRFQSPCALFKCIDLESPFHIYILDVIMPLMDGIDVGTKIREEDENAIIIYLTTSPDYAVKSYRVFAFQYLMKPVEQGELYTILKKAIEKIHFETTQNLPVKTKNGITAVRYHTIMYIEYSEHMMKFHLSDGAMVTSVITRQPFHTAAQDILKDYRFIKPHVSFVVNLSFVSDITNRDFVMKDGLRIAISKNIYTEVKKQYIDFLLKGADSIK